MLSASELIAKIKSYNPKADETLIQKAYIFAKTEHGNQKRHSGEPYFSHPLAVAEILSELKMDQDSIIAALFHDLVEDTEVTLEEIEKSFGKQVAALVDGVTKLKKIESASADERTAKNFRKLTLAMSKDIRVLLIKLADRLHNMRTLYYVPSKERKIKKARESLEIYAPLAARIGLNKFKDEMQELAFEIIDPKNHAFITEKLNNLLASKKDFIDKVIETLGDKLREEKIEFEISGRLKTPYSIYRKMQVRNVGFHHLYDIMAFRIIVKNIKECYKVLGALNSSYNMIPGTFHDYISTPKENGYRSLHLAILGPLNKKIEIQIRDHDMHREAELGVAAHWSYKDGIFSKKSINKNKNEVKQYQWIRDLISLFENAQNASDVLEQTNLEAHNDEVFCFTPNGDIFNLPIGATALDFAYAVHSEIGNKCASTKINSVIAPLRQKLENGDQVEIITAKNAKPSTNWLQFVVTPKSKTAIRAFLRNEKFHEHKKLGHSILQKYFAAKNRDFKEELLHDILPHFNVKTLDELYVKTAEGVASRHEILKKIYPDIKEESKVEALNFKQTNKNKRDDALPIDGLVAGMVVNFAGCCDPIPCDPIVGVINTGSGVTIHNQNCSNFKNLVLTPQRIIDVCWKSDNENGDYVYSCKIHGTMANKVGGMAAVTSVIAKKKINITNFRVINRSSDFFSVVLDIEVKNTGQLDDLLASLRISKKVMEVKRVFV